MPLDKSSIKGIIGGLSIIIMILAGLITMIISSNEKKEADIYKVEVSSLLNEIYEEENYLSNNLSTYNYEPSPHDIASTYIHRRSRDDISDEYKEHLRTYERLIENYNDRIEEINNKIDYCDFCKSKYQKYSIDENEEIIVEDW